MYTDQKRKVTYHCFSNMVCSSFFRGYLYLVPSFQTKWMEAIWNAWNKRIEVWWQENDLRFAEHISMGHHSNQRHSFCVPQDSRCPRLRWKQPGVSACTPLWMMMMMMIMIMIIIIIIIQMNEQTNERTKERTNERSNQQTNKQTNKQRNKKTNKQASKQTNNKQTKKQTD